MPIMLAKTYAAFKAAGVADSEAIAAAEELAGYDNRLAAIETRLAVLTWMVASAIGLVTVIGVPALWLLLRIASKANIL